MKHAELMKYVGKYVRVLFRDGTWIWGKLGYADEFSVKHNFRKPKYFYVDNISFKARYVKKLTESEDNE